MQIQTTRFGQVHIEIDDVLSFPSGLMGLESCRQWVLLADGQNSSLGWLQCTTRPEIALAVVSPRRFVPEYQMRITRSELSPLELPEPQQAQVLVIVGKNDQAITLNLKAPIVINLQKRLGRQVITNGEHSVCHELQQHAEFRKSA